jgi:hypothetical protein
MTSADAIALLERLWAGASSPPAFWLYVLGAGAGLLIFALWSAWREHRFLDRLSAVYFDKRYRGRPPVLARTKRRREREVAAFRRGRWRDVWRRVGKLLLLGIVLPTAMLAAGAHWYSWFDAEHTPFIVAATHQPISGLSVGQMAMFLLDELMRGGFLDVLEVFDVRPYFVTHNPDNYVFSGAVLAYRTFVAIFEPTVIWFWLRAWWIAREVSRSPVTSAA